MILRVLIVLACLLFPQPVFAGYETGQDLLIGCTGAYNDSVEVVTGPLHCTGYIDGILDAHGLLSSAHPETKYFCLPAQGILTGDAVNIVILYIQENHEARSMPGRLVVIKALQDQYPCK